jgi:hypothetical protein
MVEDSELKENSVSVLPLTLSQGYTSSLVSHSS